MMIRKAVVVAGVIGTVLTLINQGDFLVTGQFGKVGLMKMLLTYSVPFCVSVYSVLAVNRENATDTANEKASEPPPAE